MLDGIDHENRRYLEKLNDDFKEGGINLPEEKRQRVIALSREISKLAKDARSNIDEDKSGIEVDAKELVNLQRDQVKILKKSDKPG